jgi:hypothetical protein
MEICMSKPSENPSGQPIGGHWAQQQEQGLKKQEQGKSAPSHPQLSDEEQKKLEDEVAKASIQNEGEDDAETTTLLPEKQVGIAGP